MKTELEVCELLLLRDLLLPTDSAEMRNTFRSHLQTHLSVLIDAQRAGFQGALLQLG